MSENDNSPLIEESVMKDLAIPPRPEVVMILHQELAKDDPDLRRIKDAIAGDVALAGAILKTVNSVAFGLTRKITSVPKAIDIVGLRNLTNIVTAMALRQQMSRPGSPTLERFWDTADKVAHLCAHIAKKLRGIPSDEAYTYGLFHDCGIAVLINRFSNYPQALVEANQVGSQRFTACEERFVGTNHAIVGYFLAKSWSINPELCRAILLHHELDVFSGEARGNEACLNYVAIGHLGQHIHHAMTRASVDSEWMKFREPVFRHFGLDDVDYDELVDYAEELRE